MIPSEALQQHVAILGKTGSGKTTTAKLAIEQVVEAGSRVCILDPIKSDWWGLISSADGKSAGLPFYILGGPRGHVPLHAESGKAVAELVASGGLPLSIIDMADFAPGGHAKFFVSFAETLLKKMRGVVYLVIEEAHLFAPKERSGIGQEQMGIHWAKMLATAGRSKGIRLILVTQRIQALHNALLGSCDTMFSMRLTAPADQEPVVKWLKANVDKKTAEEISGSLSSLRTGTGWICSGEARVFEKVNFPRIKTYDNTATPTDDSGDHDVVTAKVDVDKLRAIMAETVQKATIISAPSNEGEKMNTADIRARLEDAHQDGYREGWKACAEAAAIERSAMCRKITESAEHLNRLLLSRVDELAGEPSGLQLFTEHVVRTVAPATAPAPSSTPDPVSSTKSRRTSTKTEKAGDDRALNGPQRRILDAIAMLNSLQIAEPSKEQIAWLANFSPGAGNFRAAIGSLVTAGCVTYPKPGHAVLTASGRDLARKEGAPRNTRELQDRIIARLTGPQEKILRVVLSAWPKAISKDRVAELAGYNAGAGNFRAAIGSLRTVGLIDYPAPGMVKAEPALFLIDKAA